SNMDEKGEIFYPGESAFFTGNVYQNLLVANFIASGSNPLIRKEAIESTKEFNPSLHPVEDWDFYLRLAKNWHFVVVPTSQILYRQSANSASSRVEMMEKKLTFD
ncbi:MAG: glycosyltransferase family 2 protein, partial [Calothrix sp. SM1_7_51]|nr:glycosyltransferase family 2 protein [Calothrix sp. SM1_7_51]